MPSTSDITPEPELRERGHPDNALQSKDRQQVNRARRKRAPRVRRREEVAPLRCAPTSQPPSVTGAAEPT